eukprot:augustus_masked-scaffold_9-processed-gene-7.5-mRNA-1 protein AED:1.00 eAED:1.00 QI:0/-1/0/0/-1/1/1/0/731
MEAKWLESNVGLPLSQGIYEIGERGIRNESGFLSLYLNSWLQKKRVARERNGNSFIVSLGLVAKIRARELRERQKETEKNREKALKKNLDETKSKLLAEYNLIEKILKTPNIETKEIDLKAASDASRLLEEKKELFLQFLTNVLHETQLVTVSLGEVQIIDRKEEEEKGEKMVFSVTNSTDSQLIGNVLSQDFRADNEDQGEEESEEKSPNKRHDLFFEQVVQIKSEMENLEVNFKCTLEENKSKEAAEIEKLVQDEENVGDKKTTEVGEENKELESQENASNEEVKEKLEGEKDDFLKENESVRKIKQLYAEKENELKSQLQLKRRNAQLFRFSSSRALKCREIPNFAKSSLSSEFHSFALRIRSWLRPENFQAKELESNEGENEENKTEEDEVNDKQEEDSVESTEKVEKQNKNTSVQYKYLLLFMTSSVSSEAISDCKLESTGEWFIKFGQLIEKLESTILDEENHRNARFADLVDENSKKLKEFFQQLFHQGENLESDNNPGGEEVSEAVDEVQEQEGLSKEQMQLRNLEVEIRRLEENSKKSEENLKAIKEYLKTNSWWKDELLSFFSQAVPSPKLSTYMNQMIYLLDANAKSFDKLRDSPEASFKYLKQVTDDGSALACMEFSMNYNELDDVILFLSSDVFKGICTVKGAEESAAENDNEEGIVLNHSTLERSCEQSLPALVLLLLEKFLYGRQSLIGLKLQKMFESYQELKSKSSEEKETENTE